MPRFVRRIVLEGGGSLEDVPAADIAQVIEGVIAAVTKAAGHVVGRQVKERGRRERVVAAAGAIHLLSVSSGSVDFTFRSSGAVMDAEGLPFDPETVGDRALEIATSAAGVEAGRYRDVARVWLKTAEAIGIGERYDAIRMTDDDGHDGVTLDADRVEAIRIAVRPSPSQVPASVQGRLYEANFDAQTAQLRGPSGEIVHVQYDDRHADDIYRVLRGTANLIGEVTYDPHSLRALRVRVREVDQPTQMDLSFWVEKPLVAVIAEQQLARIKDASELVVEGLSHEDWEQLRAGIEE